MAMVISEKKLWLLPSPPLPLLRGSPLPSSAFTVSAQRQKRKLRRIWLSVSCKMMGDGKEPYVGFDFYKWVKENEEVLRLSPVFLGGSSFLLVLINRALSGIAPVADASSAQSRADVLALVLSATILLTGLVWISVKPKTLVPVELKGIQCLRMDESLSSYAASEVMWMWKAIRDAVGGKSFVIVYKDRCILQAGLASEIGGEAKFVDSLQLMQGSLCQSVLNSGKQNYLANLPLYPGRVELGFLPTNTQAVILQPLGEDGVMIVGGDTVRQFGPTDQVWISSIGDKLDATLSK